MYTNPIVAEIYYNQSANAISGMTGVLHNIYGQPASYFYITIEMSNEIKNNCNSGSCIDIFVNNTAYTINCEISPEFMDSNTNDDMVIKDGFYQTQDDKLQFDCNYVGMPLPVWTLINGMLLTYA